MKKLLLIILLLSGLTAFSQDYRHLDTLNCPDSVLNVHVVPLYSDSLSSSFLIFIKKEVKLHKHAEHTEHVFVLDGEATMVMGDSTFTVKKGDIIFIPKGTPHRVTTTSKKPLKVVSLQSPHFDGKDRILLE